MDRDALSLQQNSNTKSTDSWDEMLLHSTKNVDSNLDDAPNFAADTDTQAGQAALPITRASLIPSEYITKTPMVKPTNMLVPLAGVLLAVGLVSGGSVIGSWVETAQISPENFSASHAYSVVAVPSTFLANKTLETVGTVGDTALQVSAVAMAFPQEVGLSLYDAAISTSEDLWRYPQGLAEQVRGALAATLTTPVVNTSEETAPEEQIEIYHNVAAIGSLGEVGGTVAGAISSSFLALIDWVQYYVAMIGDNWQNFLFGGEEETPQPIVAGIDEELLREQIKNEVLAELQASIGEALAAQGGSITQTGAGQGMVVVPSAGSSTDAMIKSQIQSLFSDPVLVELDDSRQTGVITPVFNNTTGENYIFVLTPIQY